MNPVEYIVRESQRAKHVRLKVSLYDGSLTVVVPRGFDRRTIPEILQEKEAWINRTRLRIVRQREQAGADPPGALPERVRLRAVREDWRLVYHPGHERFVSATESDDSVLVVDGRVRDTKLCEQVLRRWVAGRARKHLVPWLAALSAEHMLPVGRTAVRAQRTRWASCSRRKTISLNKKLLFLPPSLGNT
jgi:predicted metal-dependent hydrolase